MKFALQFLDVVNVVYDLCTEQHQSENQSFYIMPENENETIQKVRTFLAVIQIKFFL